MTNKEFIKLSDKSREELIKELSDTQRHLMIELAKITSGVSSENPSVVRKYRRKIARIKMLLYQKYGLKI